jgi:hypothetical protein
VIIKWRRLFCCERQAYKQWWSSPSVIPGPLSSCAGRTFGVGLQEYPERSSRAAHVRLRDLSSNRPAANNRSKLMNSNLRRSWGTAALVVISITTTAHAQNGDNGKCAALPSYSQLKSALIAARQQANGGFNLDMWGTVVNRDGVVCTVAFTGDDRGSQWPGSRVISAQKANTANAFSLPGLALSTANLYAAVQPGGSLYGLQHSNPVETLVAYRGNATRFGLSNDPMVGFRIGGVNVFGGGLALYDKNQQLIGAMA